MRHWYWCRITEGDEEPVKDKYRVETILKAHGLEMGQHAKDNTARGLYLVLLPEFPESIEVVELEMGVGELTVSIAG